MDRYANPEIIYSITTGTQLFQPKLQKMDAMASFQLSPKYITPTFCINKFVKQKNKHGWCLRNWRKLKLSIDYSAISLKLESHTNLLYSSNTDISQIVELRTKNSPTTIMCILIKVGLIWSRNNSVILSIRNRGRLLMIWYWSHNVSGSELAESFINLLFI